MSFMVQVVQDLPHWILQMSMIICDVAIEVIFTFFSKIILGFNRHLVTHTLIILSLIVLGAVSTRKFPLNDLRTVLFFILYNVNGCCLWLKLQSSCHKRTTTKSLALDQSKTQGYLRHRSQTLVTILLWTRLWIRTVLTRWLWQVDLHMYLWCLVLLFIDQKHINLLFIDQFNTRVLHSVCMMRNSIPQFT